MENLHVGFAKLRPHRCLNYRPSSRCDLLICFIFGTSRRFLLVFFDGIKIAEVLQALDHQEPSSNLYYSTEPGDASFGVPKK
jgi:hypothetical protein